MADWEVMDMKVGQIVIDEIHDGLRFIIMRGPSSLCAYIGVPESHPLAGFDYESLSFIDAHGGLTFSSKAEGEWPAGYWWYGWDYAHSGDAVVYDSGELKPGKNKKWTVKEVRDDSWTTIYGFGKLAKLAEQLYNKAKTVKSVTA